MSFEDYLYSVVIAEKEGAVVSFLRFCFLVCSFIYGFVVSILSLGYRLGIFIRYKPRCKVISVGNITLGGTGKTPMVELLINFLKVQNHTVAVISRGYKRKNEDTLGDETYMLKNKFPGVYIYAGANRVMNIKRALNEASAGSVILDDGFQHWRVFRHLDIVMIDSNNPFGNGYLLPRGNLREPLKALARANIFILTKIDLVKDNLSCLKDKLSKLNPSALILESIHKPLGFSDINGQELSLSIVGSKDVCLVSGIADPQSFEKIMLKLKAKIALKFVYRDHHNYQESDLRNILDNCRRLSIECIVTTEKDMIKFTPLLKKAGVCINTIALRIKLEIVNEKLFYDRLLSIYKC